jgi:hypothetical protein
MGTEAEAEADNHSISARGNPATKGSSHGGGRGERSGQSWRGRGREREREIEMQRQKRRGVDESRAGGRVQSWWTVERECVSE